jgi:hypothetical protein
MLRGRAGKLKQFLEKSLSGRLGNFIEKKLAQIQLKRVWSDPENARVEGSVIADKHMLKLHPYDKRNQYQKDLDRSFGNLIK